jgi:hypothetical protein
LVSQTRNRTEVLEIAVESVGEVQVTIPGVDANVVQGVELAAKVVVKKGWSVLMESLLMEGSRSYWSCCREARGSFGREPRELHHLGLHQRR